MNEWMKERKICIWTYQSKIDDSILYEIGVLGQIYVEYMYIYTPYPQYLFIYVSRMIGTPCG